MSYHLIHKQPSQKEKKICPNKILWDLVVSFRGTIIIAAANLLQFEYMISAFVII